MGGDGVGDEDRQRLFSLATAELAMLQDAIRAYDSLIFQVKGWAITIAGVAAGIAAAQERFVAVLGVFSALGFWVIEAHFKLLQRQFIVRSVTVEAALRQRPLDAAFASEAFLTIPGISHELAQRNRPGWTRQSLYFEHLRSAARPSIAALYLGISLVEVLTFVIS